MCVPHLEFESECVQCIYSIAQCSHQVTACVWQGAEGRHIHYKRVREAAPLHTHRHDAPAPKPSTAKSLSTLCGPMWAYSRVKPAEFSPNRMPSATPARPLLRACCSCCSTALGDGRGVSPAAPTPAPAPAPALAPPLVAAVVGGPLSPTPDTGCCHSTPCAAHSCLKSSGE